MPKKVYGEVPGGPEPVRYFGLVPTFDEGEVLRPHLERSRLTTLRVHGWIVTDNIGLDGRLFLNRHSVVTFTLHDVKELSLNGFNCWNVIGSLVLRPALDRPDRRNYIASDTASDDIEFELEPCYGLSGLIRNRAVAISIEPGETGRRDA
ncbi:Imm50 family immunity protein [Methylobacterium sp. JK268]